MASFQDFKDNALSYLVVGMFGMIQYDIHTMNTKIDALMDVTSQSKVRIDNLERQVYKVGTLHTPQPPYKLPLQVKMIEVVGIRPEQDNRIKKIPNQNII
jgi:hypothetical protein